jgi:ATP-binding cassette subfamily C protein CydD
MIALVGQSGAGKSTIANSLFGFYAPNQGRIIINDENIANIARENWLGKVAWVPQKPTFADTLAANIRLARPDASLEEVRLAARLAHVDEFIQELPDGYETQIGERGSRLSGGQAQRIALARAFLKDAPLLVLDEPTSNLDPELENLLQDSFQKLVRGRMVLVIAHRLNTIYRADKVLVLSKGKIAESGTHQELMQKKSYIEPVREGKPIP